MTVLTKKNHISV